MKVFSYKICEILKNTDFVDHLRTAAYDNFWNISKFFKTLRLFNANLNDLIQQGIKNWVAPTSISIIYLRN